MNIELLKDGSLLLLMGMGFVFFFLVIMICVMNINAKFMQILAKYFPEEVEEDKFVTKKKNTTSNDAEIALAIACAMKKRGSAC